IERDPLIRDQYKSASLSYNSGSGLVTATVTNHGYSNGANIEVFGVNEAGFNGFHLISNVTTDTFDFVVSTGLSTPTGTIEVNGKAARKYSMKAYWVTKDVWIVTYATIDKTTEPIPTPAFYHKFFTAIQDGDTFTRASAFL